MSEISPELEARMAAKIANGGQPLDDDETEPTGAAAAADDAGGITDDAAGAVPAAAEVEGEQPELIFGKYKTMEEAELAFGHLESKLGEQGSELGDTRKRLEQLEQKATQPDQPQYDRDQLDEWLDENIVAVPQLAEEARQRGDDALFNAAVDKWYEVAPRHAAAYERRIEQEQMRHELAADTRAQVAAPQRVSDAQKTAVESLTGRFEDFAEVMDGMDEERIVEVLKDPTFPTELLQIDPGDPAAQEKLLGTLYRFVKAEQVGPLSAAAEAAARAATDDARDAKRRGTLPSASGNVVAEPQLDDAARKIKNAFRADFGLPLLPE